MESSSYGIFSGLRLNRAILAWATSCGHPAIPSRSTLGLAALSTAGYLSLRWLLPPLAVQTATQLYCRRCLLFLSFLRPCMGVVMTATGLFRLCPEATVTLELTDPPPQTPCCCRPPAGPPPSRCRCPSLGGPGRHWPRAKFRLWSSGC